MSTMQIPIEALEAAPSRRLLWATEGRNRKPSRRRPPAATSLPSSPPEAAAGLGRAAPVKGAAGICASPSPSPRYGGRPPGSGVPRRRRRTDGSATTPSRVRRPSPSAARPPLSAPSPDDAGGLARAVDFFGVVFLLRVAAAPSRELPWRRGLHRRRGSRRLLLWLLWRRGHLLLLAGPLGVLDTGGRPTFFSAWAPQIHPLAAAPWRAWSTPAVLQDRCLEPWWF